MVNTTPKNQGLSWRAVAIVTVAAGLLLVAFMSWANSGQVAHATVANWTLDPQYNAKIGHTVVRVRPSDGKTFIIGENVGGVNGEGGSLYFMTNQDNYALHTLVKFNASNTITRNPHATFDKDSNLHVVWAERSGPNGNFQQWYAKVLAGANITLDNPWNQGGFNKSIDPFINGEAAQPDIASTLFPYAGSPKIYISRNIFKFDDSSNFIQVIVSNDGGANWSTDPGVANGAITNGLVGGFVAGNNRIAVAPNDNLFVTVKREDTSAHISHIYGMARIGGAWQGQQDVSPASLDINILGLAVGADSNNNGYIFFNYTNTTLFVAKWNSGPATPSWTNLSSPYAAPDRIGALDAVGPGDGSLWVSISNINTSNQDFSNVGQYYVLTQNGGASWETGLVAHDTTNVSETSASWGCNNQVSVAWKSTTSGVNKVQRAYSAGGGYCIIPAPSNLTATANSPTQVTLNWTNNSAVYSGIVVERGTTPGSITPLITLAGTAVTFQDPVAENTTYYYRVRAFTGGTFSAYSNVAQALTPLIAPTGLQITGSTINSISLQWVDNSGQENSYKVEQSTNGGGSYTELLPNLGQNAQTFTDTNLQTDSGAVYTYRVRAFNSTTNNYSAYSNVKSATTLLNTPTGLAATSTSDTEVLVTWNNSSNNESGFIIERKLTTALPVTFAEVGRTPANIATFTDRTAVKNTGYDYRVKAYNTYISSIYSTPDTTVTGTDSPTALTVTGVTNNSISLQFTDNASSATKEETGFEVFRRTLGGSYPGTPTFTLGINPGTGTVGPLTDSGLTAGTVYYYKVRATGASDPSGGPSGFSNEVSASTIAPNCVVTSIADTLTAGTLRTVLTDPNCNKLGGVITFNLGGSGLQTISVVTALPTVVNGASISGSCGSSGALIRLDAQTIAATLVLNGNNNVYGLQLRNANAGGKAVTLAGAGVKMSCVSLLRT